MPLEDHISTAELRAALEKAKQLANGRRVTAIEALRLFVSGDLTEYNWSNLELDLYDEVGRSWEEADAADADAYEIEQKLRKKESES